MNIIVTGGEGQLARCLKQTVENNKTENNYYFFSKKDLDITNEENIKNIFTQYNIEYVVNCAAYTNVDAAINNIDKAYKINKEGPYILSKICKEYNTKLIHISTDFVFSGTQNIPYKTKDCTHPLSVYGHSKKAGESLLIPFDNVLIIRTSWLYSDFGKNFFNTMYDRVVNNLETFVVNDQIGTPTYAMDLSEFIYNIIEYNEEFNTENKILHYSNEGCCSWYDFAKTIELIYNIKNNKTSNIIKPISTYDYEEMVNKILALRPKYSVLSKDCLKDYNYAKNRHWIEALMECIDKK